MSERRRRKEGERKGWRGKQKSFLRREEREKRGDTAAFLLLPLRIDVSHPAVLLLLLPCSSNNTEKSAKKNKIKIVIQREGSSNLTGRGIERGRVDEG
jgi:hypothetical protein